MKKGFLLILIFFIISPVFCQETIPDELCGIWEGKDRFIFIEKSPDNKNPEIVILLKMFYGYYLDFTAEPRAKRNERPVVINDATEKDCEHITFSVNDIDRSDKIDTAWEIKLNYSKRESVYVPVAVLDGKMYLNFFVKNLTYDEDQNPIITSNGFWRGNAYTEGIKACIQKVDDNIPGFYVNGNEYFDVRFWRTDSDFSPDTARLIYNDKLYEVYKHIYSAGTVYSCVTGRSHTIRNVVPPFAFKEEDYLFNEDKTLMIPKGEPYLVKVADKETYDDLVEIVRIQNSIIAPMPLGPFADADLDLDFHWDLIDELEKYHKEIQALRQRQKEFGPRPRDVIKKRKEELQLEAERKALENTSTSATVAQ